jgi:hypothetical protein
VIQFAESSPIVISNVYEFVAWLLPFAALAAGQIYAWWDNSRHLRQSASNQGTLDDKLNDITVKVNGRLHELLDSVSAESELRGAASATVAERAKTADLLSQQSEAIEKIRSLLADSDADRAVMHAELKRLAASRHRRATDLPEARK